MRFLVDAQLPPALARRLVALGHVAAHVFDVGLTTAADRIIEQFAVDDGAVIVTKDQDFAVRYALRDTGPSVMWVRVGNLRRAALLTRIEAALPDAVSALERGDTLVEMW